MDNPKTRTPSIVGQFVRQMREAQGLSQRSLGMLFEPAVTTQFISNIERGVTPLPTPHISTLVRILKVNENDLMHAMEKEYAIKISAKIAHGTGNGNGHAPTATHSDFLAQLTLAYHRADPTTQSAFKDACKSILKLES